MGNEESKIAEETRLPRSEVAWLHERYDVLRQRSATARDDSVLLTKPQFVSKFPESQHDMAKLLFDAMDVDRKGVVDFRHFCAAVTVLSRGSKEEKLDFAFRLYDHGDKGYIDARDMRAMAVVFRASSQKIAAQLNKAAEERDGDDQAGAAPEMLRQNTDAVVTSLMTSMDRDGTGRISKEEFVAFCEENPGIIAQVEQTYSALKHAAMFDWSHPNKRSDGDCVVA